MQSLRHIPRWVRLVQKTRSKNSHAWAPLRAEGAPWCLRWTFKSNKKHSLQKKIFFPFFILERNQPALKFTARTQNAGKIAFHKWHETCKPPLPNEFQLSISRFPSRTSMWPHKVNYKLPPNQTRPENCISWL